ncbi:MAG TPA: hypothetical protein VGR87_06105 [Candidatus Limnocylindria bacterium]|jgi:hypothetical protein|nr:hypothetical protein [Candidatus Limnocylindria bacterium]
MLADNRAHADFRRARRRAFWRGIASWLVRADNALLAFEDVRRRLRADAQREGGVREVAIDSIVGSVGRYRDFDRAFLPRQVRTAGRWESVDRAYLEGLELPPIELYKIGDSFFVKDGNHRVSVARERGQAFIDARVIEVMSPAPVASVEDLLELIRKADAVAFYATSRLTEVRPGARIELTLPGQYEKLLEHITAHRWFLGIEAKHEIAYDDAVAGWYDRVYLPTVEAIRSGAALRDFPDRTEGDLYLWITEHHWYLHEAGLAKNHGLEGIVSGYVAEHSERPLKRLTRAIRRRDPSPETPG